MLVVNLASLATLWFGGHLVVSGGMQIGALTAFLSYLVQVLMAVMMATFMFLLVPRAEACAERVEEVLDMPTSVLPPADPIVPQKVEGRIEFRDVEFHYPGAEAPVLKGINLVRLRKRRGRDRQYGQRENRRCSTGSPAFSMPRPAKWCWTGSTCAASTPRSCRG